MTTDLDIKLCHICGADVEPSRLWQYEREGVFQPLLARCELCSLRDLIAKQEAALADYYRNLAGLYKRLLDLTEGRTVRDR